MSNGLIAAQEARAKRIEQGLNPNLNPIERHKLDPLSKAKAIKAKCCDCVGGPHGSGWKQEITNCLCLDCPLYALRPYQQK